MKRYIIYLNLLFFCTTNILAQTHLRLTDVRALGMGMSSVTTSFVTNPACLSLSTNKFIEVNYSNKYHLKELSTFSSVCAYPNYFLPFGVQISSFGYDKYRQTLFRLFLSKQISSKWILGLAVQYALLQTELSEEVLKKISTDIGFLFKTNDNLLIGLSIIELPSHLINQEYIDNKDFKYYSIQTGFQYQFINNLLITVSANYENNLLFRLNAGLEYTVYDRFFIRLGCSTNPLSPTFGLGLKIDAVQLNVASIYHQVLGFGSAIGFTYSF